MVANPDKSRRLRIAVISSNDSPWGGSEELWKGAALALRAMGHEVEVIKPLLLADMAPVRALAEAGCRLHDIARPLFMPGKAFRLMLHASNFAAQMWMRLFLMIALLRTRPQFALLSQAVNWDGMHYGRMLRRLGIPYAIVAQKAAETYWPPDSLHDEMRAFYRAARLACFVSRHNRELTEAQVGEPIAQACVVSNPFLVPFDAPLPWPEAADHVDFACVGRLYTAEKGQDLLLRVLASDKWRARPVGVTFYGEGCNERGLAAMAEGLGLERVRFAGQVSDVAAIWRRHPALLLPSRCEGLPLVVIEAMLAGRVVIATDAGGTAESFEDGESGFLAAAPTVAALDEAMERAWAARDRWPQVGAAAARAIRGRVGPDPGRDLAGRIVELARGEAGQAALGASTALAGDPAASATSPSAKTAAG